jgi:hypothetical protein
MKLRNQPYAAKWEQEERDRERDTTTPPYAFMV